MIRPLLLVSAWADTSLRHAIADGRRPRTEFFELERMYGARLLDWSRVANSRQRGLLLSLRHVAAALASLSDHDVVLSDGEHIGIPLALAMKSGRSRPHVVIGHRLTALKKQAFFRLLRADRAMTRIIVHSRNQLELAVARLGISRARLQFVPYSADTRFWVPAEGIEEELIVSAGQEHRDYAVLAKACGGLGRRVLIAAGSLYSPKAVCTLPPESSEVVVRRLDHLDLRAAYARATLVVVPLLPNDFQAGVTTILEAMAMEKAVVVSATEGQRDVVVDGETGILVPPGDADALRDAVRRLIRDPTERRRLGRNAREAVESQFSLDLYVGKLAANMQAAVAA